MPLSLWNTHFTRAQLFVDTILWENLRISHDVILVLVLPPYFLGGAGDFQPNARNPQTHYTLYNSVWPSKISLSLVSTFFITIIF